MKIAMGCAKVAYDLKEAVKAHVLGRGFEVVDFCEDPADPMPYAEVAARAAQGMLDAGCERGILFCGTGMGVSLVANLFPGITAAVVESKFAARRCRYTNNANVLCLSLIHISYNFSESPDREKEERRTGKKTRMAR